eukprot:6459958-Amphidinium_carterae.1
MEDTMNQLIAEVQRLVTEQQAQAGVIANLRHELTTAQNARGGASGNQKMDPLKLGKPPMFTGDEAKCEDWAFKLKAFKLWGKNPQTQFSGCARWVFYC